MTTKKSDRPLEFIAGALLSLAGAATSWGGYQATLWGGIEAESYSRATALRLQAGIAEGEAGQMLMIDGNMFAQWLNAHVTQNRILEDFYQQRFRPEFVPAFEAWKKSDPVQNPDALPSPLSQPEYKLALREKSIELNKKAEETFSYGLASNTRSDNYVLITVIFGLVMFFGGIAQQFDHQKVQIFLTAMAAVMAVIGLYQLIIFPVAPS